MSDYIFKVDPNMSRDTLWDNLCVKMMGQIMHTVNFIGRCGRTTFTGKSVVLVQMENGKTGEQTCGILTLENFNAAYLEVRASAAAEGEILPGIVACTDKTKSRFQFEVYLREIGLEPMIAMDPGDSGRYAAEKIQALWHCWQRARQQQ